MSEVERIETKANNSSKIKEENWLHRKKKNNLLPQPVFSRFSLPPIQIGSRYRRRIITVQILPAPFFMLNSPYVKRSFENRRWFVC